jgi:hypothetical protein
VVQVTTEADANGVPYVELLIGNPNGEVRHWFSAQNAADIAGLLLQAAIAIDPPEVAPASISALDALEARARALSGKADLT